MPFEHSSGSESAGVLALKQRLSGFESEHGRLKVLPPLRHRA